MIATTEINAVRATRETIEAPATIEITDGQIAGRDTTNHKITTATGLVQEAGGETTTNEPTALTQRKSSATAVKTKDTSQQNARRKIRRNSKRRRIKN